MSEVVVEIVHRETDEVVESLRCKSSREAMDVRLGVTINLDVENYYLRERTP